MKERMSLDNAETINQLLASNMNERKILYIYVIATLT